MVNKAQTEENTKETKKKRHGIENLIPYKKGQSGNPNGRPKGVRPWHVVMRELFEKGEYSQDELVLVYIEQAKAGNLKAIEWLAERMDGKAKQEIMITDTEQTKQKLKEMFEASKNNK